MTVEEPESFVADVEEPSQAEPQGGGASGGTQDPPAQKPDELRQALTELAGHVKGLSAPAAAAKPELSKEERDELWAVYNPEKTNPDFFKKWMRIQADADPNEVNTSIAERRALFAEMQQGLVKQAVVGSRNIFQSELAKLREEYAPLQEFVSTQRAEQMRSRFFSSYEGLKDPKFSKVIDATARVLSDKQFPDEASYFKALAEGAAETIKGVLPEFDLGAVNKNKPAVTSPRLPRTSVGGTGGSGGGKTAPVKASDDDSDDLDWMK